MDVFKTLLLDTPDSLNAITGILQIANGGTGATDAAGARDNLLPDYTGNVGKVLTVNAGATDVEWTTNGAGTVTSVDLTAGTGVSVSGGPITSSGSITVTNTAPDQTVVLTAGTGINTSGTYPSFTVTNSAPDQTVAIAAGTGISVSGSYPSFTVTNSAPSLGGDVVGPASSTDNAVVRFDSTTGKLVQNSGVTISDADLLTTTDLTVNDDTVLGSSNTDTVNFNARVASDINPSTDNTFDLGIVGHEWRDLNIDGTANIDSLVADSADINGGTIDGTTIGATTPSTVAATTLSASGASSFTNSAPSVIGGLGFRNRVINGDMRIDQRNEGASVTVNTSNTTFSLDSFLGNGRTSDGVFTMQRSTTAPAGFTNSFLITVTTADASIAATDRYFLSHNVEGLNCSDFGFGTASAKTVTLSFWVRSSVTGTFSGSLSNSAFNRAYPFTYTINAADTFEYKTITIPGDTSGTWLTTNGIGIRIYIDLGAGANFRGTAGSWSGTGVVGATSSVNLIGTASATWYLTGVQLEIGNAATEFERRPFGQELALCQRYYATSIETGKIVTDFATINNNGLGGIVGFSTAANGDLFVPLRFPVSMRSNPTLTVYSGANRTAGSVRDMTTGTDVAGFSNGGTTSNNQGISYIAGNALTANRGYGFHYVASAEY